MAGVTSEGFTAPTFGELRDSLRAKFRTVFGNAVNVDTRSRNGQLIELFADPLSSVWEIGETLAAAFDPDGAIGVLLENLSALTGTTRRAAFPSLVDILCVGTVGTVLATGRRVRVDGTTAVFESTAIGTGFVAAFVWSPSAFAVGQIVSSDGACWLNEAATAPSSVAPAGDGPLFEGGDGNTWRRLGDGDSTETIPFESVEDGPVQGYSGTLTIIDSPTAGWGGAFNPLDATPGKLAETDAELRVRRAQEVAGIGSAPLDAIRARLLRDVPGITSCVVFENTTDITVDGITPHAIECMVEGGDDVAIQAAIFAATAGGIETCGTTVGAGVVDSAGNSHVVKFSRPHAVPIYLKLFVTKDPASFPVDGENQIKAAVVAWGDARSVGRDVVATAVGAQAFKVEGVLDVPTVWLRNAPAPFQGITLAISVRQRATYDTSRIAIELTDGVL